MMHGGAQSNGPVYVVRNGAVAVPANFVGLHFRAWPAFNAAHWANASQPYPSAPSPAPTIAFKGYRSHDSGFLWWNQIETSAGVYDWTYADQIISTHKAAGREIVWCGMGTPDFYLSAGNPYKGTTQAPTAYPDGTSPNGMTGWANFITALITRYNTAGGGWASQANGGGTNWSAYGKGVDVLEIWNEPGFFGSGFFADSATKLVDMAYVMKTNARAVDASIPILSPGFSASNLMQVFFQASGTIYPAQTGLTVSDKLAYHFYNLAPNGLKFGRYTRTLEEEVQIMRTVAANAGAGGLEVWITETGIDDTANTDEVTKIGAMPAAYRYAYWCRMMMMGAAYGFKRWMCYAWDTPYLCYPDYDPNGTAKAINDVCLTVSGKTITDAWYMPGGAVTLKFSDGSSWSV
jgi:hypothetical protein